MTKIFGFGCSVSVHPSWVDSAADHHDLYRENLARGSGNNTLQIKKYQELILDKKLNQEDIIIWQITCPTRAFYRLPTTNINLQKIKLYNKKSKWPGHVISDRKNIFDGQTRIDFLSHSDVWRFNRNIQINDENQNLEDLLFHFIAVKKINPKILVFRGWEETVPEVRWCIFKKILEENDIKYLDECLVEWTRNNKLTFEKDGWHPTMQSRLEFGKLVIIPAIADFFK